MLSQGEPEVATVSVAKEQNFSKADVPAVATIPAIPDRYAFRTDDGFALDIRTLFMYGFIHPQTKEALSVAEIDHLKAHKDLGFSVIRFHEMEDIFSLNISDEKEIDFEQSTWTTQFAPTDLAKRQACYAHFAGLVELLDHFTPDFLQQQAPEAAEDFTRVIRTVNNLRSTIIWYEMDNQAFFANAAVVIQTMKNNSISWSSATEDFFNAIKEFALEPEVVIKRAGDHGNLSSRNYQEYVVRVNGTQRREPGLQIMRNLVLQFKRSFATAYQYDKLPELMEAMTPHGTCIAEKMRAMASLFNVIESLGPERMKLNSLHALMHKIIAETKHSKVWATYGYSEESHVSYIRAKYLGTPFVNDKGQTNILTEKIARAYLIHYLAYTELGELPALTLRQKESLSIFNQAADPGATEDLGEAEALDDSDDAASDAVAAYAPAASYVSPYAPAASYDPPYAPVASYDPPYAPAASYHPPYAPLPPQDPGNPPNYCYPSSAYGSFFVGATVGAFLTMFDYGATVSIVIYSALVCGLAAVLFTMVVAMLANSCFNQSLNQAPKVDF